DALDRCIGLPGFFLDGSKLAVVNEAKVNEDDADCPNCGFGRLFWARSRLGRLWLGRRLPTRGGRRGPGRVGPLGGLRGSRLGGFCSPRGGRFRRGCALWLRWRSTEPASRRLGRFRWRSCWLRWRRCARLGCRRRGGLGRLGGTGCRRLHWLTGLGRLFRIVGSRSGHICSVVLGSRGRGRFEFLPTATRRAVIVVIIVLVLVFLFVV